VPLRVNYFGYLDDAVPRTELLRLSRYRRWMLAEPAYLTVHAMLAEFMAPRQFNKSADEACEEFARIVEWVRALIHEDSEFERTFEWLSDWLLQQPSDAAVRLYSILGTDTKLIDVLVPALFGRAVWMNRMAMPTEAYLSLTRDSLDRSDTTSNQYSTLGQLSEIVERTPHELIHFLAIEAAVRAADDPGFDYTLSEFRRRFMALAPSPDAPSFSFGASATGLETLGRQNLRAWWAVPVYVSLAMTIWNKG
jgi:hypothetical protein